ncbi:MAG TPA: hypothetical protein DD456_12490 [Stenotrophomonas sp.]|nr:hypothetical protein [Stenotrophomonas sp.]
MARAAVWICTMLAVVATAGVEAAQAGNADQPVPFKTKATVWLDEQGVPQQVETPEQLPSAIRAAIGAQIKGWRFEPATVDGQARRGVTHLMLDACAVAGAAGELNLALGYVYGGPVNKQNAAGLSPPPRYPVDAVRSGIQGTWLVTYEVLPDGTARWMSVDPQGDTNPKRLGYFEPTLRQWVSQLRYQPEEVDGRPISTVVRIPVGFSLDTRTPPTSRKEEARTGRECVAAMQAESPMRTASDTQFKLISGGS